MNVIQTPADNKMDLKITANQDSLFTLFAQIEKDCTTIHNHWLDVTVHHKLLDQPESPFLHFHNRTNV